MTRFLRLPTLVVLAAGLLATPAAQAPSTAFLFSYFVGNGEDGLHLASSEDGLIWTARGGGRSYLRPEVGGRLMRDPCLIQGPDGRFHLVWTTGWWDQGIGVAQSRDLRTWTAQAYVPVMAHEPTAKNAWAPEIFYDRAARRFVIYWASTIPGRFPETEATGDKDETRRLNHRLYATSTTDFETYTPTRLFYDGGFNVIDGTMVDLGTRVAMIVKDETRWPMPKKHLRVTFAAGPGGPWSAAGPPFTPDWVEGPTVLRVGDRWLVYFDEYTRKRYGAMRTADFIKWEDISSRITFPAGMRHGTALAAPRTIVDALR